MSKQAQKLKEIHEKLKKWSEENGNGNEELDAIVNELAATFDPSGDDDSNPPSGPGTPP